MADQQEKPDSDPTERVTTYISRGFHSIVSIEPGSSRDQFRADLKNALVGRPVEHVRSRKAISEASLIDLISGASQTLVAAIGRSLHDDNHGIFAELNEAVLHFAEKRRQGFIVIEDDHSMFCDQKLSECWRELRSAMHNHDDIAVVLVGSKRSIRCLTGNKKAPFYGSFVEFCLR